MSTSAHSRNRVLVMVSVLAAAVLLAVHPSVATADTAPAAGTPATVSADGLPTVQENGVVWSEVTVGNTVYATGSFTETWPARTTDSAANETARTNLLAFDITTGNLITSFNHALNAQGLAITASPDGSRVYVGGDFTTVDGLARKRIAAFDTATGALDPSFLATAAGEVRAISATNTAVYVGGTFSTAGGGYPRNRLAAYSATNGALIQGWAPSVEQQVDSILVTPDQTEVIIGGAFLTLNGSNVYGLGAVTTATGASVAYAANQTARDYTLATPAKIGDGAAILSLSTDGSQVYVGGYSFNEGNFEGTMALVPDTGVINFVNDCHGDTYDVQAVGSVLYSVGHAHDCSAIGQFPDTSPRISHHALAQTVTKSGGTNTSPDSYGWKYAGVPDSTLLQWYPEFADGTITGQNQATWAVTGNSSYVVVGGEFPSVNGTPQAGLVRFAISSAAPNQIGPGASLRLTPTLSAPNSTSVKLNWTATSDRDNQSLRYDIYRDGAGPVYSVTTNSNFWTLPSMSFLDTGLVAGSTHNYLVRVSDPFANTTSGSSSSITLSGSGGGTTTTSASDSFARTVTGGWGVADRGGTWTASSTTAMSVAPGAGSIKMAAAGSGPNVYLTTFASSSTDTTATVSADKLATGNGVYLYTIGRWVSSTTDYRLRVRVLSNSTVGVSLLSDNAGTQTVLAGESILAGVTYTPGLTLNVRLQVTGTSPTMLNANVWPTTATTPTGWLLSATDSTGALQRTGSVGFAAYLSGTATNAPVTMAVSSFATGPAA